MNWVDAEREEDIKALQVMPSINIYYVPGSVLASRATGVIHRVRRDGQEPKNRRWYPEGGGTEEVRDTWKRRGMSIWEVRKRS